MNIAIAGYGLEGEQNYRYWNTPGNQVTIVDAQKVPGKPVPDGAKTILGPDSFSQLNGFDMVVRTASLAPTKIQTDGKVWSATNEFFTQCPAPIIGVTGTKGKGTTSSMIASMLRAAGKTVHLVGNIGVPALGELAKIDSGDIVVFELSSFQLWDLEKSPHIAAILMIEPDHLNVHKDFDDYVNAKANIRRFQTLDDACVYHPTNTYSHHIAMTGPYFMDDKTRAKWEATADRYGVPDDGQVYVNDDAFYVDGQRICGVDALRLPGAHNLENACAAISVARHYAQDSMAIENGLRVFTGLPHRLKFVAEVDGVRYFDDSIATTPGSAIAALRAFEESKVIILGGSDKGSSYGGVISICRETGTKVIAVGETGAQIAALCEQQGVECKSVEGRTMADIVTQARAVAVAGDVVILSPASASFDMFKSYSDRGDQFVRTVQTLLAE